VADDLYGVLECLRRARTWMPLLSVGQQRVYTAMLLFCSLDGVMSPTAPQLAELTGLKDTTIRTRLYELRQKGALVQVGRRPRVDDAGIAHGASIPKYSIPLSPLEVKVDESHYHPEGVPPSPQKRPTLTSGSDTLKVEKLKPSDCRHLAMDEDGYCTACKTQVDGGQLDPWQTTTATSVFDEAEANLRAIGVGFEVVG
jgi:ferredoxin